MATLSRTQVALLLTSVVATVGLVDSFAGGDADLGVVFGAIVLLVLAAVGQLRLGRRSVPVRRDHARWLTDQATATGESPSDLVDRAIAAYRASLVAEERE